MRKSIENQALANIKQTVENQGVWTTPKPLQSHSKTTPKHQTVENQALDEIFWSFGVILGKVSFLTKPTRRLTSQSVGTIFACQTRFYSIHYFFTPKTPKTKTKNKANH